MKINEIKKGMRDLEITGKIIKMGELKQVVTRYGPARLLNATFEDDTGSVGLNLWRDQIDKVHVGDTVTLRKAFATVFMDNIELNIGRDGAIIVTSKSQDSEP